MEMKIHPQGNADVLSGSASRIPILQASQRVPRRYEPFAIAGMALKRLLLK